MTRIICGACFVLTLTWAAAFAVVAAPAPATVPADVKAAEDLLASKGLTRSGALYLIDEDLHLAQGLRTMRAAKKLLDDNAYKRQQLQAQVKSADAAITEGYR